MVKENIVLKVRNKVRTIFNKRFHKNKTEDQFLLAWTHALSENAEVFRGLYTSLQRISDGKAKKKGHAIHEWHVRTQYNLHDEKVKQLSMDILLPLSEHGTDEEFHKWANLLLKAADGAGIKQEAVGTITLDESNTNAYSEWNGEPLYLGDTVEVTVGAWYQNGKSIEQGYCKKAEEA